MGPVRHSCAQSLEIETDSTTDALCAYENKTNDDVENFRSDNENFTVSS